MKSDEFFNVDIGDAVSISHQKSFVPNPFFQPFDASAGLSRNTRIDEMDLPMRLISLMDLCFAFFKIESKIIIQSVEI